MEFSFSPIGIIRSPYRDKFGIPRQPGLVTAAAARLELLPAYDREEAFKGIDGYSHVWLLFVFHDDCLTAGRRPTVRPPRLGGRERVGVFASRAPYRPNPIGLSAVEHLGLERGPTGLSLRLRGVDLLDGTPVLDVKPYVPYADALPQARSGFAVAVTEDWQVVFSSEAESDATRADPDGTLQLRRLVEQVLAQDPRPGYMDRYPEREHFAMRLYDLELRWRVRGRTALVIGLQPIAGTAQSGPPD
ncbi:MAG TPA: tRNA (N6-threonylcarbamoyladenosine(37)-N6)-methyltransferase TrmO [Lamprocystis sp. (in: g-proteobacteria)]|nr:tRNA (N6-threonylcarbamoyladenosine(37)-N6)-methyltransferase TrmO [Lamprocystis sp. (in: g-proteobacteria)]